MAMYSNRKCVACSKKMQDVSDFIVIKRYKENNKYKFRFIDDYQMCFFCTECFASMSSEEFIETNLEKRTKKVNGNVKYRTAPVTIRRSSAY